MTSLSQVYKREYRAWNMVKNACLVPTNKKYYLYGGEGVTISKEWEEFVTFFKDMGEMPDECDGMILQDRHVGYTKFNVSWGKVKRGIRPEDLKKSIKPKKTRIKNSMSFCLSINQDHYAYIKRQAIMRSQQTGDIWGANDLIRDALVKAYPFSGQYDFFGSKI